MAGPWPGIHPPWQEAHFLSATDSPEPRQIHVLVIEDEAAIADTILYALRTEGMQATHEVLGRPALERLRAESFSLVILDVGLPDANGFDLCRELRRFSEIPVIFLTARADEVDRVVGLEIGADDYVTKPFSPRELAARVRVILRRGGRAAGGAAPGLTGHPARFRIDETSRRIYCADKALDLTRYEYHLLRNFLEHPEQIFSRDELMQRIWTAPDHSLERTVDSHIKTLRAKVRGVLDGIDPIETHRGLGYSWKPHS
jgi:two-component system catabolic regulation response regulator CreB